jgi:hypothetical protein
MRQPVVSFGFMPRGQLDLPGTGPDISGTLQRKAEAPLKPKADQQPCDVGLFSDDGAQLDLVYEARKR